MSSETTRAESLTVEQLGPGRFTVRGGAAPHLVDVTGPTAECDCADRKFRHRICRHIAAVDRFLVERGSR